MSKNSKPLLGLIPRGFYNERVMDDRYRDVCAAIARYYNADREIPIEWVDEFNELVKGRQKTLTPRCQYPRPIRVGRDGIRAMVRPGDQVIFKLHKHEYDKDGDCEWLRDNDTLVIPPQYMNKDEGGELVVTLVGRKRGDVCYAFFKDSKDQLIYALPPNIYLMMGGDF